MIKFQEHFKSIKKKINIDQDILKSKRYILYLQNLGLHEFDKSLKKFVESLEKFDECLEETYEFL